MDLSPTECRLHYMLEEEKKDMSQKRLKIKLGDHDLSDEIQGSQTSMKL